jgi:hypothetical protein
MSQKPSRGNGDGTVSAWEQRWRARMEAWRSSGQSQSEFCRSHGIAIGSFSHWKGELARREQRRAAVAAAGSSTQGGAEAGESLGWREVGWPAPGAPIGLSSRSCDLELLLPRGWSIRLGPQFEAEALRRLLGVLEGLPC